MKPPGKKIGTLTVKLHRKVTRYQKASVQVEQRFDTCTGNFHASYEGVWFHATTQAELAEQLRGAIEKTIDLVWTRYLVVHYHAEAWPTDGDSNRPNLNGHYERLNLDYDRAKLAADPDAKRWQDTRYARVLTDIGLKWEICDFSEPYTLPEDKNKRVRMKRDVDRQLLDEDKGYEEVIGEPSEQDDDTLPDGCTLWTAEREAFLREVLVALGKLDARMVQLFRGDPGKLGKQLDAAAQLDPGRLLAGGKER